VTRPILPRSTTADPPSACSVRRAILTAGEGTPACRGAIRDWKRRVGQLSLEKMLSRMSSKRCIGSLEGTNDLDLHTFLHSWLQCSFLDQVHWCSEQVGNLVLNVDDIE
jgi:hypothetical protein